MSRELAIPSLAPFFSCWKSKSVAIIFRRKLKVLDIIMHSPDGNDWPAVPDLKCSE